MPKSSFISFLTASLIAVCFLGCNTVIEPPDPVKLPEVPEKVVNMFKKRFPDATETTMRVVEKDRLWEADFKVNSQRFYAGMDSVEILRRVRLEDNAVPDSILQVLSGSILAGVQLHDFHEQLETFYLKDPFYCARYTYKAKEYIMLWQKGTSYILRSLPHYKFETWMTNVPRNVEEYVHNDGLKYLGGIIFIDENNRKRYQVSASNGDGTPGGDFVFDNNGSLIYTNYNPIVRYENTLELPEVVKTYLHQVRSEDGFEFSMGYQVRGTGGYVLYLTRSNNRETIQVVLDKDTKELEREHILYVNW